MTQSRLYIAANIDSAQLPEYVRERSTDIEHFVFDSFGIDDARLIQQRAYRKPVVGQRREFVIHFSSITSEAQHALLKLLEEPPEYAVFHTVVARKEMLLPTLLSRLFVVSEGGTHNDTGAFDDFLSCSVGERLDAVSKHTKDKDTVWIDHIIAGAEMYVANLKGTQKNDLLASIVFVRTYLSTRGSSSKMLLEELALSLPTKS